MSQIMVLTVLVATADNLMNIFKEYLISFYGKDVYIYIFSYIYRGKALHKVIVHILYELPKIDLMLFLHRTQKSL